MPAPLRLERRRSFRFVLISVAGHGDGVLTAERGAGNAASRVKVVDRFGLDCYY